MRIATVCFLLLGALGAAARESRAEGEIPEPRFDRVDYAHPEKYVAVPPTLGKRETLEKIAAEIQGTSPREKLVAIGQWIDEHLKYDATTFDRWRDVDKLLADGTYGGCADHAECFGAVARACGIPVVWVKSLDLDWIAWFRAHPDQPKSWSGHVFTEIHLDGKWRLYDASQRVLYDDYDVRQRILPGRRLAYDKGGDAFELLLSTRWEDWKQQTRRFVETMDPSLVPVGEGTSFDVDPPGRVYVAATHPQWKWVMDRVSELGAKPGGSGASDWERWMPNARRGVLIVPCIAGRTVLPKQYWALLPTEPPKWKETLGEKASLVVRKKAADGTDVVEILARDDDALWSALGDLDLDGVKSAAKSARADKAPRVFIVAHGAQFEALASRLKDEGFATEGGDGAYDQWLPKAKGGRVVVAAVGDDFLLPDAYRSLLPADAAKVSEILKVSPSSVLTQRTDDGTEVVLIVARDKDAMRAAIAAFKP